MTQTASMNMRDANVGLIGPINKMVAVTPGASPIEGAATETCTVFRGLWVGVSGNVDIKTPDGTAISLKGVAAGMWHPFCFTHVTAATATDIVAGN